MLSEPNANEDFKKNGERPYGSDGDIKYGWFSVRPGHMQMMLKPVLFLMTLAGCCSTQIFLGHMLTPITLVLKQRYLLTDKDFTGFTVAQGISTMISVIIVGYLGSFRARKIYFIAVGMALSGLGAIFFAVPHFQTDDYEPNNYPKQLLMMFGLCGLSQVPCQDESVESKHMALFIIGQILIGLGQGPLYCLIPAYIDENIKPKWTPMALLPWYGFLTLGPVIGMGAAALFSQVYIDIDQPELMHKMDVEDIRWRGAWWLGYIVIGCCTIFNALIIAGFPPSLPGSQSIRDEHILAGNIPTNDGKITQSVSGILHATTSLLKNTAFVFNTLANLCIVFFVFTMGPFILQMVVIKYGADHLKIGLPVIIVLFLGLIVGTVIGAYLTKRIGVKNLAKGAAFLCLATQALCILAPLLFVVPGCNDSNIAGVNKEYPAVGGFPMPKMKENSSSELTAQCNKNCKCGTVLIQPVCGSNNIAYFDPCHAGCLLRLTEDDYANCTCIPPSKPGEKFGTAKKGFCDRGCGSWRVFLFVTFLALVIFGTNVVPSKVVVLRCVRNNQRSYALAVQTFLYILAAFIPTHLVKHIMDRDCNIWQTDPCGNKGICWDYNTESMSKSMTIFGLVVTALATTFYFFSWYAYTPPKTMKTNRLLSDTSAAPDNFEDPREPETKL